jgi:hypothetical protein
MSARTELLKRERANMTIPTVPAVLPQHRGHDRDRHLVGRSCP